MKIRWENKVSKETGFVKKLNHKDGYFENTYSEEEAMEISDRQDIADKTVALLNEWCGQNTYTLIPTEKKPEPEQEEETAELVIEVVAEEDKKAEPQVQAIASEECTPSAETKAEEEPAPTVAENASVPAPDNAVKEKKEAKQKLTQSEKTPKSMKRTAKSRVR